MVAHNKLSYTHVKDRYETLRKAARNGAFDVLPSVIYNKKNKAILKKSITLDGFTFDCQRELKKWEKIGSRRVVWNWDAVQKQYRAHPKRFEVAIWHNVYTLCGAGIGKPTVGGGKLRLDYIEASPDGSPLEGKTTDIIISAAAVYADAIGAIQLRIMNPVNDRVKDYYLSKPDFSYDERGKFCYMDL